jgi:MFS family permease
VSARTVLSPYTRLFTVPGARAFSTAGWLARLPSATVGLGTVLLVQGETGSYGVAGAVSGTLALAFAAASPRWGRAADRFGQGRVLRTATSAYLLIGVAFVVAVVAAAPRWSWFVLAALTGASAANIGSLVRARWAHALGDPGHLQTAFAFESVVDEVVFVVGPPLATVLAATVAPAAGFVAGLVAGVVGGFVLSRLEATEPPVAAREAGRPRGPRPRVLSATLLVTTVTYLAMGAVFGAMDVVVVGFATAEGQRAAGGLALACYAAGSLVAGLVYGLLRLPGTLAARFVVLAVLFGLAAQLLYLVGSLVVLVPVVFLAGLTIAPVLVSGMSLVESRVPRSGLTEGLAWTSTGLGVGVTVGSALAGRAVDAWGAQTAFAVPALAAAGTAVVALLGSGLLRRPVAA